MGGGSGAVSGPMPRYSTKYNRTAGGGAPSRSMNGPVDRVYHFTGDSHEASHISTSYNDGRKKHNRSRSEGGGSWENGSRGGGGGSGSNSRSYDTIDGSGHKRQAGPLPPPPGLRNVGNSCYANAALQCLLSTALPHALLDERNAHIIRRHSFNRKLLVHGSGSVDSDDDDGGSIEEEDDSGGGGSTFGSCLSGMSCAEAEEEDDDVILARAVGADVGDSGGDDLLGGLRASPARSGRGRRRPTRKQSKGEDDDSNTVTSGSTLYSDMYHVMKSRQKNADEKDSEADLLCAWLTQELTQITREYTTPPQGFKAEKRKRSRKGGRGASPTNFLGVLLGGPTAAHGPGWNNRVVDPGSITRHVHKISPCLHPYQQEDAHEFFRALLSSLTMHGQNARLSSLFDGLLESSVTCKTCCKTSLTRDRYMDLSLDIAHRGVNTLERALEKFTEEETLDGDNKVMCSRCDVKRAVTKGLRLATAPTMLVINYKRFAYDNYGRLSRLSKQVHFPLRLELGEYMSRANRGKPPPYTLVAVLVHRGRSCDCGHYFAYVRKGRDDWYLANDADVTKVDTEEVLRAQAYVLVYEVAGMKEKHNFDCYSRYHRSLDEEDEESMARGVKEGEGVGTSWDFSAITSSFFEVCDAGLCGNVANVLDHRGEFGDGVDSDDPQVGTKHSLEDNTPPRRGGKGRSSPPLVQRGVVDNLDTSGLTPDGSAGGGRRLRPVEHKDFVKAYYKRGRSHTPSRLSRNRDRHYQLDRDRGGGRDSASGMHDSEPPMEDTPGYRRAKSLGRAEDRFKATRRVVGVAAAGGEQRGSGATRRAGGQPSRRRVPSRPRGNESPPSSVAGGKGMLPPLRGQGKMVLRAHRNGGSMQGVML